MQLQKSIQLPTQWKSLSKIYCLQSIYQSPNHPFSITLAAEKLKSKLVSTVTSNISITKKKQTLQNFLKAIEKYNNKRIKLRIAWSIVCKSSAYITNARCCNLGLFKKHAILQADHSTLLKKWSKFISKS